MKTFLCKINLLLFTLFCLSTASYAQKADGAILGSTESAYNFGEIYEENGPISHTFIIFNKGNGNLVISRVTSSCGCTKPEWNPAPIAPGDSSEVTVTYDPAHRPGPFHKMIYLYGNQTNGRYVDLLIKGFVRHRPPKPKVVYPYAIGDLKLSSKKIYYNALRNNEQEEKKIQIKNGGTTVLDLKIGKTPSYLTVKCKPMVLVPDSKGEISFLLDASKKKNLGRIVEEIALQVRNKDKKREEILTLAANLIPNTSEENKKKFPVAELSANTIDFGDVSDKGGGIPLIGGRVTETFTITNTGNNDLNIYSFSSDDQKIDMHGGAKLIHPSETKVFKVTIKPKQLETNLSSLIYVICNDPKGPVRIVKVIATK
ncbi:MAG: DUF1573 domain-containing protein [Massilibacteroides sp.]|nr:DUF1573 domain-containing protein [Massilibacteroides sp.]